MEHVDKVPAEFKLKGTEFVSLKRLSGGEQKPWIAQIRGLTGKHVHLFLKSTADGVWGKLAAGSTLTESEMEEARDRAIQKSREIVASGVIRLFEVDGDSVQLYRISEKPVGEHGVEEVSLDLLLGDYAPLVVEIMRMSALYIGGVADNASTFRTEDETGAGRPGEAIRGEASRVG